MQVNSLLVVLKNKLHAFWRVLSLSSKFKQDVLTNYLSLIFLGLGGVVLNVLVARYYGSSVLGFFNKVYAIYMVTSQFAVGSVHLSVQKYIASAKKTEQNRIINSGLVITFIFAIITVLFIFLSRDLWAKFLKSPEISLSIIYILPGLVAFALNKTLLAFFNGLREMKVYAFFQTLRYFFILLFAIVAVSYSFPKQMLPIIFTAAEVCLFLVLFVYAKRYFKFIHPRQWQSWLKTHLIFSYHSFLGNVLADANVRVSILILSYFVADKQIGIYSFAASLAEGFSQLFVVLKINVNPILVKLTDKKKELEEVVRHGIRLTYRFALILGLISIVLYPILIFAFVHKDGFMASWPVFAILMTGIILGSGYQPFQMLLAQSGFPKLYTSLIAIVFVTNMVLNFILIPIWGIYGSAIATGASFVVLALVLKALTKRAIKINI